MDANEATRELAAIRRIMESATQITVLPGWAAIIGGGLALTGCGATYALMGSADFAVMSGLEARTRAAVIALWVGIATAAVAIDVIMTVRLARRRGREPWSRLSQLAAYSMGPAVCAAVAIGLAVALRGEWGLLPGICMMLYGIAVWMAGILSIHAPGVLGLVFLLLGAVTLFWAAPVGLVMVGVTFGAGHVVFGAYLLARFGA